MRVYFKGHIWDGMWKFLLWDMDNHLDTTTVSKGQHESELEDFIVKRLPRISRGLHTAWFGSYMRQR